MIENISFAQLLWLGSSIIFFLLAIRYVYYAGVTRRRAIERAKAVGFGETTTLRDVNGRLVVGILWTVTQVVFFAIGILGIRVPEVNETAVVVLVSGVVVLSVALTLASNEAIPARFGMKNRVMWLVGGLVSLTVVGVTVWVFVDVTPPPLQPAPFVYSSDTMTFSDPVLCPGDPFTVNIRGFTSGLERRVEVDASIFLAEDRTRRVFRFPTFVSNSPARPEAVGQELEVQFDSASVGWFLPEQLEPPNEWIPGTAYIYSHGNAGVNTLASAFEATFAIGEDCDG